MRKILCILGLIALAATGFSNSYTPVKGGDNGLFLTSIPTNTDTVFFTAGQWTYVYCTVSGTPSRPLYFVNKGGLVEMSKGFNIAGCHDINIVGTNIASVREVGHVLTSFYDRTWYYGFYIHDGSGPAVDINHFSDHITIKHVRVSRMTYFIWAKQEVDGNIDLNYPNTPIHDIIIDSNYFKGAQQDGLYCGSTGPTGGRNASVYEIISQNLTNQGTGYTSATVDFPVQNPNGSEDFSSEGKKAIGTVNLSGGHVVSITITFAGSYYNNKIPRIVITGNGTGAKDTATMGYVNHTNYIPGRLYNIAFTNNYVDSAGRTGAQFSGINAATSGFINGIDNGYNTVANNIFLNLGFEFNGTQGAGAFLGGMAYKFKVHNNLIENTWSHGIFTYGVDTTRIYNNTIDSTGYLYGDSGLRDNQGNLITHSVKLHRNDWLGNIYGNIPFSVPQATTLFLIENNINGVNTDHGNYGVYMGKTGGTNSLYATNGNIICNSAKAGADAGVNFSTACVVNNSNPVANAGADPPAITLPTNSTTFSGSGTDIDGDFLSYAWNKVSGSGNISSPTSATTAITGLLQGTSTYRLTVSDGKGGSSTDDVQIVVNAAANTPPTANAGSDATITTTSIQLAGSGSDLEGSITYSWTKINGPNNYTFSSTTVAQPTVSSLIVGIYQFELTVTDNNGATAKDTVQVTVNSAVVNQAPIVVLPAYSVLQSPDNSTVLDGSGSYDPDGNIVTFIWTQTSSDNGLTASINSPNSAKTAITGLQTGKYVFRLTVVDNNGTSVYEEATVYTVINIRVRSNGKIIRVE